MMRELWDGARMEQGWCWDGAGMDGMLLGWWWDAAGMVVGWWWGWLVRAVARRQWVVVSEPNSRARVRDGDNGGRRVRVTAARVHATAGMVRRTVRRRATVVGGAV